MRTDHGYARYTSNTAPCRCDTCRKAKADYMRRKRAQGRFRARAAASDGERYIATGVTHGTRSAYDEHGCRCVDCTDARTASDRRYQTIARARQLLAQPAPLTERLARQVLDAARQARKDTTT